MFISFIIGQIQSRAIGCFWSGVDQVFGISEWLAGASKLTRFLWLAGWTVVVLMCGCIIPLEMSGAINLF